MNGDGLNCLEEPAAFGRIYTDNDDVVDGYYWTKLVINNRKTFKVLNPIENKTWRPLNSITEHNRVFLESISTVYAVLNHY